MNSNSSRQNVVVINSSHYLPTGSGNKFVYPFQPGFNFSSSDRIGVQSLSIFNSFFNISQAYGNNTFKFSFPCFNPNGSNSSVFEASIGNAVQFDGQITNPTNIEITGATITSTATFTAFIGGARISIAGGYVSSNLLRITSGSPALANGMYINGSSTYITGGNNTVGWTLSSSSLGTIGSSSSPVATIFATPTGNILYVTTPPSAAMPSTGTAVGGTIYVTASGVSSQTIVNPLITTGITSYTLSSSTAIFLSSRQFTCGIGTNVFSGFSDGVIYNGMQFFLWVNC